MPADLDPIDQEILWIRECYPHYFRVRDMDPRDQETILALNQIPRRAVNREPHGR